MFNQPSLSAPPPLSQLRAAFSGDAAHVHGWLLSHAKHWLTIDSVLVLSRLLTAHFSAVGAASGTAAGAGDESVMPPPLLPSTSQLHTVLRLLLRPTDRAARPFEVGPPARAAAALSGNGARSRM